MSILAMKQALEALKNSHPYSNMDKELNKHSEYIMNKRIRKLIRKLDNEIGRYYWTDKEKEKFAELIVRECADLFDKDEIELSYTMRTIHNTIKEHFGVE
jgi:recombinational DNA repair ATPase RecF